MKWKGWHLKHMIIDLIASQLWKGIYILITMLVPFKFVLNLSSENHLVVKGKMSILPRLFCIYIHDSIYSCIFSSFTMKLLQLTCWRRPCSIERLVKRLKIAYPTSSIIVTDDWFSWQPGLYLTNFLHLGPDNLLKSDLYIRYCIVDLITPHYWLCSCELCICILRHDFNQSVLNELFWVLLLTKT